MAIHSQVFTNKYFSTNLPSKRRVSFFGWGLGRVVSHHFQAKAVE